MRATYFGYSGISPNNDRRSVRFDIYEGVNKSNFVQYSVNSCSNNDQKELQQNRSNKKY